MTDSIQGSAGTNLTRTCGQSTRRGPPDNTHPSRASNQTPSSLASPVGTTTAWSGASSNGKSV
ncbi:MAG: hypothetical protein IPM11_08190 [Micropruina sp.]|nr:hypothetical protein [Micropruina sp.]